MADEISRVAYYIAAVPNKAGEGARILTAFKDAGVNLLGFLGYRKTARTAEIVLFWTKRRREPAPPARKPPSPWARSRRRSW
jgi:hypothetical protein